MEIFGLSVFYGLTLSCMNSAQSIVLAFVLLVAVCLVGSVPSSMSSGVEVILTAWLSLNLALAMRFLRPFLVD